MSSPPLRKRLGQHHLRRPELCRPMVDFLRPDAGWVVEIGPGGGALTGRLLEGAARVLAWEFDPAWAFELGRRVPDRRLTVVAGDALELPWERLPAGTLVAGNLPYGIATPLVLRLLPRASRIPRVAFLVQLEVARRLLAAPGDSDYGSLAVLREAYAEGVLLGRIRRAAFRPEPKVDGAMVGLSLRPAPLPAADMARFAVTLRVAFGQRRKTLRNSLAASWGRPAADRAVAALGLDARARAGELSLADFLRLHRLRPGAPALEAGP